MSNKEIYKKTLTFSVRRLLFDIITFVVFFGIIFLGFFIGDKAANAGIVGLVTGVIIAFIVLWLLSRFIAYTFSAGQICMMTAAITEGSLPDDVYAEGKRRVKERFGTVAIYFAATNTIRGIFRQIGRGISSLGRAVGGDAGDAAGSAISIAIDTLVRYLSDCCLGWVFFRKDVNAGKATLEGSVLFFKHGKTFGKNMGRIFGMGLASLLLIGGAFSGVFYLIFSNFKDELALIAQDISATASADSSTFVTLLENPTTLYRRCHPVEHPARRVYSSLHPCRCPEELSGFRYGRYPDRSVLYGSRRKVSEVRKTDEGDHVLRHWVI